MEKRSPATSLLLAIFVPFYYIYWLYATGKTINGMGGKAPNILLVFTPFLLLIGAIFLSTISSAAGVDGAVINVIILLIGLFGIPALIVLPIVYDYKFSKEIEKITNGQIGGGTGFVLMLFVAPAAVYVFQDKLNDVASNPSQTAPNTFGQPLQPAGSPVFASNQQPVTPLQQPPQYHQPQEQSQAQPQSQRDINQEQPPQTNQQQ